MEGPESYLKNTFDEIVFERRNQEYGSFALRRAIPRHTRISLLIISISVLLFILSGFIDFSSAQEKNEPVYSITDVSLTDPPPILDILPPPAPALPPVATQAMADLEVKNDEDVKDNTSLAETSAEGDSTSAGDHSTSNATGSIFSGDGKTIYKSVEVMPEYPGGKNGLKKYLSDNVKYPETARKNGITGTVLVLFVVNEDGSVSDISIEKGIGGGCDQEAMRLVENMRKWKPGKQGGEPKAVYMRMPITFNLGG